MSLRGTARRSRGGTEAISKKRLLRPFPRFRSGQVGARNDGYQTTSLGQGVTGFTLIELVITIAISTMIIAVLYFSLNSALDSWEISQDQLLLQQVSSRLMEELSEGLPDTYGLRDALEIVDGSAQQITTVMPWTDDTHDVYSGINTYELNKHFKPGTSLPITEALLPESKEYKVVPIALIDKGKSEAYPEVYLKVEVPAGTSLRFTFHPDYKKDADVQTFFRYDADKQAVFIDDKDGSNEISKNNFGVKITDFMIRYFDNTNTEVGVDGSISNNDIPVITGLEISFTAQSKNGNKRQTLTFVCLRNAPMRSGNFVLHEGARFPIPNSKEVKALFLTNLYGIRNNDVLVLDAKPESGKDWRLTVQFAKYSDFMAPIISIYSIEYPAGNKIYSERPRTPAEYGLNLLTLGPNGLYDYDDDGIEEPVILSGKVTLEVDNMEIGGASLFVRP